MGSRDTALRDWISKMPVATVFTVDDAQDALPEKTRAAIKMALSRLSKEADPTISRLVRGLYSRRRQGKLIKDWMLPRPETDVAAALPWLIAGKGAGLAPPNAMNAFGWSTQVPPKLNIVVVGRPPRPPDCTVRYWQRSNHHRQQLTPSEVTLLEAASGFDMFSEMKWDEALSWLAGKYQRAKVDSSINTSLFIEVSQKEAFRGMTFLRRCEDLAGLYEDR